MSEAKNNNIQKQVTTAKQDAESAKIDLGRAQDLVDHYLRGELSVWALEKAVQLSTSAAGVLKHAEEILAQQPLEDFIPPD